MIVWLQKASKLLYEVFKNNLVCNTQVKTKKRFFRETHDYQITYPGSLISRESPDAGLTQILGK